jgi:hypothetical protein
MATQDDVRRIALSLPETIQWDGHFHFSVPNRGTDKGFAWMWMERVEPGKPRVPRPDVLAIKVLDLQDKAALIAEDPETFFGDGSNALLVRLEKIGVERLEELLIDAWRIQAPRPLAEEWARRNGL